MASTDARPVPQKGVAYRITFPLMDADGDLVTGATGLDSEISKDAGAFADCTNEATEIATSSGVYYLDLTSTEMNADTVAVIVKTTSVGAKTTTLVMYPEEAGDIRVNVTAYGGTAGTFAAGRPEVNTTHAAGTAWASGAITAAVFAADAITAAKVAADVGTEIGTAVWATTTRLLTAGTNIALAKGTGVTGFNDLSAAQVNAEVDIALADVRLDELLFADSDIDGAAPPTVGSVFHELMTKTAGSFTYDQTTDSLEAVRDRGDAAWATAAGFSTHSAADVWAVATRVLTANTNLSIGTPAGVSIAADIAAVKAVDDAIKAKTDSLTFTVAGQVDANLESVNAVTVNGDGSAGTPWGP